MGFSLVQLDTVAGVTKLAGYEYTKHINYLDTGEIIAIRALNVKAGFLDLSNVQRIEKKVSDSLPRSKLYRDEIVLTYTGSKYGDVARIEKNDKYHLAPNVAKITVKEEYDSYFYYLVLQSPMFQSQLKSHGVGSSQPTIPMKIIRTLKVPLPSIEVQREVSGILRSIYNKIELNNQVISNLEQLAQTLFKRWFVDFEFLNENGEPYKSSGGEMVESKLGMIPKGWTVELLGDISEIQNGFAFKSGDYTDDGIKVLRTLNIHQDGLIINNIDLKYLPYSFYHDKKYQKQRLEKFDSLLVMVGATIGKLGIVLSNNIPSLQNQNMWRFRANKEEMSNTLLYFHLKDIVEESINWRSGSAREFFRKDSFSKFPIVIPTDSVLIRSKEIFEHIFNEIDNLNSQAENLQSLRDVLLPKLLSGEIELPDKTGDVI